MIMEESKVQDFEILSPKWDIFINPPPTQGLEIVEEEVERL